MANELSKDQLKRLARLGAHARLEELDAERRAILKAFPGLAANVGKAGIAAAAVVAEGAAGGAKARRRRKKMSAAQRKAASERMKKFWADRKKAEA